jgi:hypothetical protein
MNPVSVQEHFVLEPMQGEDKENVVTTEMKLEEQRCQEEADREYHKKLKEIVNN